MDKELLEGTDLFNTNQNKINNALKIMDGKYGGGFWVRYLHDTGTGTGWLQLEIEYPTGTSKMVLLCKNVCKETNYEEDGIGTVFGECYKAETFREYKNFQPYIEESANVGNFDIFRKYERPDMPIPASVLWQRIIESYTSIPIVEVGVKTSVEEVYSSLLDYAEDNITWDTNRIEDSVIYFKKDEMEKIVESCGYSLKEIRVEFAVRGLLDCDKNSRGYQKTKKINGKNIRFYALRTNLEKTKNVENIETVSKIEDVSYSENPFITKDALKIRDLEADLKKEREHVKGLQKIILDNKIDVSNEEWAKMI